MTFTTSRGHVIDTESQAYKDFLRWQEWDKAHPDVKYSEPAPYRTLGDVMELERRRREHEAAQAEAGAEAVPERETVPA